MTCERWLLHISWKLFISLGTFWLFCSLWNLGQRLLYLFYYSFSLTANVMLFPVSSKESIGFFIFPAKSSFALLNPSTFTRKIFSGSGIRTWGRSVLSFLEAALTSCFYLLRFSCFAQVEIRTDLLVCLNLNQSNRRSAVQWYLPMQCKWNVLCWSLH